MDYVENSSDITEKRMNLHEMQKAETTPIPNEHLLDKRETHIDYQKSGRKVLHKDDWRDEKNVKKRMDELWKGKTIYKIKKDYVIPEGIQKSDLDRLTRVPRGNIDDLFHPESSSSSKPVSVQKKPSSQTGEAGKKLRRGPGLREIEVGPPAAKRHVGKQKPVVVDDSKEGSSKRKKVIVSYPNDGGDELDRRAREMGLKIPDYEPQVIESKSAPARARSKQDSEGQIEKLGSEALEPRRISVPLPGSEVQAMTPAYKKMLKRLEDSVELYKLHVKHYHMSPTQFRRRTSMLGLPDSVYEKYEDVCQKCRVCSTSIAPPPRARVSGIRASNFGDVIFVDHAEVMLRKNKYMVLLVLDGATNLLWATAQSSLSNKETIQALRLWSDENNCMPKAIVGDDAFFQEDFLTYYRTHGFKECPCGSRTPWPNRTETAVRLFKRQWQLMTKSLNRLGKFLISLGIQPTRADRCTYVCYDGAFKEPKQVSFADSEATEPVLVTYYVCSHKSEVTQHESTDIAEEVHKSLLVEERLFSACYQQPQTWKERKEFKEKKKVEDCAWTPVVDETLLKFLDSVEHKPGWYPFETGHAQVAYRAKSLRTPDQYYDRKKFHLRTSIVKRRGVWWLLEMNHDMNKELIPTSLEEEAEVLVSIFLPSERTYLATTPQLTPEIVEELLEHFMDPVNGSIAKGRKPIGMCCLHVDDLFIKGTPEFLEKFKKVVKSQFKIGHEDVNDLMFTGQRVKWVIDEKTRRNLTSLLNNPCVSVNSLRLSFRKV